MAERECSYCFLVLGDFLGHWITLKIERLVPGSWTLGGSTHMFFRLHVIDKEAFYFSVFFFFFLSFLFNAMEFILQLFLPLIHTFSSSKINGKYFFETCKQCLCLMAMTAHYPLCTDTAHLSSCHLLQLCSVSWHISLGLVMLNIQGHVLIFGYCLSRVLIGKEPLLVCRLHKLWMYFCWFEITFLLCEVQNSTSRILHKSFPSCKSSRMS